jgi:ribosomal-protein-alanine N-acetyltransferase
VRLRFASEADAACIHRWRQEPSVRQHQPIAAATLSQLRAELAAQRASALRQGSGQKYQWIVEVDAQPAGWLTLVVHNWEHGLAEVGYALSHSYQRRGLMRRALAGFVEEVFLTTRVERLEARCSVDNLASRRVLEACGFSLEGILRGYFLLADRRVDNLLFSRLRSEHLATIESAAQSR